MRTKKRMPLKNGETREDARRLLDERSIPEPNTGCWLWTGYAHKLGYGQLWFTGRQWSAHRLSAWAHHGLQDGECACHRCDNPSCVNPAHIFLGTQAENLADMDRKGRRRTAAPRGEACGKSRLTLAQVVEVRERLAAGEGRRAIASRFGVSHGTIGFIATGKTWR